MSERVKCTVADCDRTILSVTVEQTGGPCMPCYQAQAREIRQARARASRVEVDRFEGVEDLVEIAVLLAEDHAYDPAVVRIAYPSHLHDVVARLTSDQHVDLLARVGVMLAEDNDAEERAMKLAGALAAVTSLDLAPVQTVLLARQEFRTTIVFRAASTAVVKLLLEQVESADSGLIDGLLSALAWTRHPQAIERFREWGRQPPEFAKDLYVPPSDYLRIAGHELRGENLTPLFREGCRRLVATVGEPEVSPVQVIASTSLACEFCGEPLTVLFDLDLMRPELQFLELGSGRLRMPICERCSAFGTLYFDIDRAGQFVWSSSNRKPEYADYDDEWVRLPEGHLQLGPARAAAAAADWLVELSPSQLGGLPTWVQDEAYPACPSCAQTMGFVGQLSCDDIDPTAEGIYYAFLCAECLTSGSTYQQS